MTERPVTYQEARDATVDHDRRCVTCKTGTRCQEGLELYLRWYRMVPRSAW